METLLNNFSTPLKKIPRALIGAGDFSIAVDLMNAREPALKAKPREAKWSYLYRLL